MNCKKALANFDEIKRKAEIVIGKQRNGPIGDFDLIFLGEYATFENKLHHPALGMPETSFNGAGGSDQPF